MHNDNPASQQSQSATKNIVVLAHRVPYPPNKGEKIRIFNQIKYLREQGHTIHLVTPIEKACDRQDLQVLEKEYACKPYSAKLGGRINLVKGLMSRQALSVANFYTSALQKQFDHVLETQPIDAIICTSSSMADYVFKTPALRKHPQRPRLIMDFMDLDSDKWKQYESLHHFPLKQIYRREAKLLALYERKILDEFDHCLFISQSEVDLFAQQSYASKKVQVIANGIDTDFFHPNKHNTENAKPLNLLFTGVMDYFPNIDAVIWFCDEVWPAIRAKWPDANFFIAGMNPTKKVQALGQLPGVTVTGYVDDILSYFHQADLFVAPFRLARGVQNKVLQAFACGLPVISSKLGYEGIDCQIDTDCLLAENSADYILQIEKVLQNEDYRQSLAQNALALVNEKYSWHGQLEQLDYLID